MTNTPLYQPLTTAMLRLSAILMPDGYHTTDNYDDINSYEKIKAYHDKTGSYLVWTGASNFTVYGPAAANVAFRSVHDWIHIHHNLGFNQEDEEKVFKIQKGLVRCICFLYLDLNDTADACIRVMEADLLGIIAFHKQNGYYPLFQGLFVRRYMEDPERALLTKWRPYVPPKEKIMPRTLSRDELVKMYALENVGFANQEAAYQHYLNPAPTKTAAEYNVENSARYTNWLRRNADILFGVSEHGRRCEYRRYVNGSVS